MKITSIVSALALTALTQLGFSDETGKPHTHHSHGGGGHHATISVPEDPAELGEMTMRERLAAHAINPTCAACHYQMDPIGLGMENYDATGAWRDRDGDLAIDPAGQLPGDLLFSGPTELSAVWVHIGVYRRVSGRSSRATDLDVESRSTTKF